MTLTVRPLTPELWPALEELFGPAGASNGCWCTYWLDGPRYRERPRDKNKTVLRNAAKHGPPPGLLAFSGDLAVGWCRLAPRADLPWLERNPRFRHVDDAAVWALCCLYVRKSHRRRGVTSALIAAAVEVARGAHAPALEAYPVDVTVPGSTRNLFTGIASAFRRAGFVPLVAGPHGRLIMRHPLRQQLLLHPDEDPVPAKHARKAARWASPESPWPADLPGNAE